MVTSSLVHHQPLTFLRDAFAVVTLCSIITARLVPRTICVEYTFPAKTCKGVRHPWSAAAARQAVLAGPARSSKTCSME
jgi:hypothetical protein